MGAVRAGGRAALTGVLALAFLGGSPAQAQTENRNFRTHLSGAQEVPARDTQAQGQATFALSPTGDALSYRVVVANIENVVASHIHLGAAGENGAVVAFLYGNVPAGGGRTDGVLATGTITSADLIGPLSGQSLDDLLEAMRAGLTYVNVHTNDGVGDINSGPGDFPGGEVRGQISGG